MSFLDHRGGNTQPDERDDFLQAVADEAPAASSLWCDAARCRFAPLFHRRHLVVPARTENHAHGLRCVTSAGMDPGQDFPPGPHFGLDVMRSRAASIGGHLEIRSAPGRATEVAMRWPTTTQARRSPGC